MTHVTDYLGGYSSAKKNYSYFSKFSVNQKKSFQLGR